MTTNESNSTLDAGTIEPVVNDIPTSEEFASFFGDISDEGFITDESAQTEAKGSESQDAASDTDTAKTGDDKFELDGVDLSHIPQDLRKETLKDTLDAVEEDRQAKIKEAATKEKDLTKVKDLLKEEGLDNGYAARFQRAIQSLDTEIQKELTNARGKLQHLVDAGELTEAQANLEYGKYSAELESFKREKVEDSYKKTNLSAIEDFISENEDVLKNEHIQEAATVLLTDIIKDGNLVDIDRSRNYLSLGRKLYDEGYKQGLAAAKQQTETAKQEGIKRSVSNPQVSKSSVTPARNGGIPYASVNDVPDSIWFSDTPQAEQIRRHFLKQEMLTDF